MNKQNVKGGQVIHLDITRHCTSRPAQKRDLVFECHLHKAVWWQRIKLAFHLLIGKPIHLVMGGERMRMGDRIVSEIEL